MKANDWKHSLLIYQSNLLAFFASVMLTLITVLDVRRGLLNLGYIISTPFFSFSLYHVPLATLGIASSLLTYTYLKKLETDIKAKGANLATYTKLLASALITMLVIDLFIYRSVAAARIAAAKEINLWEAITLVTVPFWLRPVAAAINYMVLTWHAIMLSILFAAAFLAIIPHYFGSLKLKNLKGIKANIVGTVFALPQPFCSCCASPIAASFSRQGVSLGFATSFLLASPMLNLTTFILATQLLPPAFALTRILAGVFLAIPVAYAVSFIANKWLVWNVREAKHGRLTNVMSSLLNRYCVVFHLEDIVKERGIDSPVTFVSAFSHLAQRIARLVVLILFLGSVVTAAIVQAVLNGFNNDVRSIIAASIVGSLLMIPTWTEIPVAQELIRAGLTGPAASLLVTLPPISLPCLLIFGGALGNFKTLLIISLATIMLGIAVGFVFL